MLSSQQRQVMVKTIGACRFVYNKALSLQNEIFEAERKHLSYADLCKRLTEWRNSEDLKWLSEAPAKVLQQALKDLDRAYVNFQHKRANLPTFRKKNTGGGFRTLQGFKIDNVNGRVFFPKMGWLRYRKSRDIVGDVKSVTIIQNAGEWYVSVSCEIKNPEGVRQTTSSVGIDMGVVRLATLSTGEHYESVRAYRDALPAIKRIQRSMCRKVRYSNNWIKEKSKLQRLYRRIADKRSDYIHKITTAICKNHALVCIEDLNVSGMSAASKGGFKRGLSKAILDQGWFMFRRQLEYKLEASGGLLIAVDPRNTSRKCPACGHIAKENRLTQAHFECVECGFTENADLVGAVNILAAGYAVLACGEAVQRGRSVKQEPAEAFGQ